MRGFTLGRLCLCSPRRRTGAPSYGPALNTATAKKIAAGTLAECQKNRLERFGRGRRPARGLLYYERMEDTQYASNEIAIGKARAAATYRRPTRAFADVINKGGPATATLPGVVASPGGVPLIVDGKIDRRGRRERRHRRPGRAMPASSKSM